MENTLTFDQLPQAVATLTKEISELKQLLLQTSTQQTTTPPEQLLTVKQAADFLNLCVPTVYSKVSRGELPVMKRGKRLHFSNTELMQYLKEGRKRTNSEIQKEAQDFLQKRR
ncbi:helix-turn-helix domain-containing protein [Draconibacterium sediminis]|uniref:Excisionase n=1 Tax=Draconibacterium sediminis TaxID=1544798 RepID=A0A0D8J419_9BACT|nr:helix-turn-helix domain-containing protein [Draconibacterium sediminis]KJF41657.1 excisionase [Draconibacterium sediminis]